MREHPVSPGDRHFCLDHILPVLALLESEQLLSDPKTKRYANVEEALQELKK